jgi:hypothetical protein
MSDLSELANLRHNRGLVQDPQAFADDFGAASWLFLYGEAFAEASDRPVEMTMDLARRQEHAVGSARERDVPRHGSGAARQSAGPARSTWSTRA